MLDGSYAWSSGMAAKVIFEENPKETNASSRPVSKKANNRVDSKSPEVEMPQLFDQSNRGLKTSLLNRVIDFLINQKRGVASSIISGGITATSCIGALYSTEILNDMVKELANGQLTEAENKTIATTALVATGALIMYSYAYTMYYFIGKKTQFSLYPVPKAQAAASVASASCCRQTLLIFTNVSLIFYIGAVVYRGVSGFVQDGTSPDLLIVIAVLLALKEIGTRTLPSYVYYTKDIGSAIIDPLGFISRHLYYSGIVTLGAAAAPFLERCVYLVAASTSFNRLLPGYLGNTQIPDLNSNPVSVLALIIAWFISGPVALWTQAYDVEEALDKIAVPHLEAQYGNKRSAPYVVSNVAFSTIKKCLDLPPITFVTRGNEVATIVMMISSAISYFNKNDKQTRVDRTIKMLKTMNLLACFCAGWEMLTHPVENVIEDEIAAGLVLIFSALIYTVVKAELLENTKCTRWDAEANAYIGEGKKILEAQHDKFSTWWGSLTTSQGRCRAICLFFEPFTWGPMVDYFKGIMAAMRTPVDNQSSQSKDKNYQTLVDAVA